MRAALGQRFPFFVCLFKVFLCPRPLGDDGIRVEGGVASEVVDLDVIHVDRLADDAVEGLVEILWDGEMNRVFFHIPDVCSLLSKPSKDGLVESVERGSQETKLLDFLDRADPLRIPLLVLGLWRRVQFVYLQHFTDRKRNCILRGKFCSKLKPSVVHRSTGDYRSELGFEGD